MSEPIEILKVPEPSEWRCEISGGLFFAPTKGKEPNWFWRWMQYLAFGFRWKKTPRGTN